MPQDARVTSALRHWAAALRRQRRYASQISRRFTALRYSPGPTGASAWSGAPPCTNEIGADALARAKLLSAGRALQRAGVYYHCGKVPIRSRYPEKCGPPQ